MCVCRFVEFATTREVLNAIQTFNNYEVDRDKKLVVKVKEDRTKREERMAWLSQERDFLNSLNATGELEELEVDRDIPDNPLEPRYIPHHSTSPEKPTLPASENGGPSDASLGSSAGAASLKASPPPTASEEISANETSPEEHNKGERSKLPCHVCQTPTLKKCCKVPYCSKECQEKDWPMHKKTCSRSGSTARVQKQPDSSPPLPKAESRFSPIPGGPLEGFYVSVGGTDDFEDDDGLAADASNSLTPNKEKPNELCLDSVEAASSDKSPSSGAKDVLEVDGTSSDSLCPYPSLLNSPLSASLPSQEELCDDTDNSDDDDVLDCQPKTPPGSPPIPGQSSNTPIQTPPPSQDPPKEDTTPACATDGQSENSSKESGVSYLSTREVLAVFDQCPTPLSSHPMSEFPPVEFVGIVTSAFSPTQFHMVLATSHVREVLVKLLNYGSSVTPTYCGPADLNEGSLYGYIDDYGDFYRVELVYRSGAVVLYDMGLRLTVQTSRLFQLSEEIESIPRLCFQLTLQNLNYDPDKKEDGREFLFSLMKGRPMAITNHSIRAYKSNVDINFIIASVASLDHSIDVADQVLKNDFARMKKEDNSGKSKSQSMDSVFRKKLESSPSKVDSSLGKPFPASSPAKAQGEKESGGSSGVAATPVSQQTSGGFGSPPAKTPLLSPQLDIRKPMFIDGSPDKIGRLQSSVSTNQNGNQSPEIHPQTPPTQKIQSPDGKSGIKYKLVQMSNKVPFHNPPVGVMFEIRPKVVLNPNIIWAHVIHDNMNNFKLMETDLNKVYGSRKNEPYAPAPGEMCAAKYPQDQKYYRVEVLCVNHSGTVDIRLVDYGHRDTVTMRQIHHLEPIFLSLPKQALQFSLVGVVPAGMANTWSDNAIAFLKEKIMNRVVPVKIVMQTPATCMAEVWDPDEPMQLLNTSLVELGLAQEASVFGHFSGGGIMGGDTSIALRGVSVTARQDQPKAQPTASQDREQEQLPSLATSKPVGPSHPSHDSEQPLGGSTSTPNPANPMLHFSLPVLLKPMDFEKPKPSTTFNPLLSPPSSSSSSSTHVEISPGISVSLSKFPKNEANASRSISSSSSSSVPSTKSGESVAPNQFSSSVSSSSSSSGATMKASGWSPKQPSTSGDASVSSTSSTYTIKASGWSPKPSSASHTVSHSTEPTLAKVGGWGPKQPGSNGSSNIISTTKDDMSTATMGRGWSPKPPGVRQSSMLEREQEPSKSSAGRERSPQAQTGHSRNGQKLTIEIVQLESNSRPVEAIMLHVENPLRFCIQIVKDESCDSYMKMANELNQVDLVPLTNPNSSDFCLCRFSSDGTIGRVKVLKVENDSILVQHIDYGNRKKVTLDALFKMDQQFTRIPAQAIHCTLNHLLNPSGKNNPWTQEAMDFFLDKVRTGRDSPDVLTVTCVQIVRGGLHVVNLITSAQKGGKDLLGLMVEAKLGGSARMKFDKNFNQKSKQEEAPKGRRPNQSPFSKSSSSNLIGSPIKQSTSSSEGGLSWTKSSSSESTAAAIAQSGSPFKKQSMKSPFSEGRTTISPFKDSPHKSLCKSPEMMAAAVTQADSPFKKQTIKSPFSEGGNRVSPTKDSPGKPWFKSESARAGDSKPLSSKRAGVLVSAIEKVLLPSKFDALTLLVTEVCSPDEFYVHTADSAGKSDELFTSLCEYFSKNKLQPLHQVPAQGSLVCAKFSQDGAWYRAEVLESSSDSCRVRFIDFGNTETVQLCDMTECPSEFVSIPILASCCRLGGVAPPTGSTTWSDEATLLLKEVSLVQAEIVDSACSPPSLKLSTKNGMDIATELINRGLAATPRASATVKAVGVTTYPQVVSLPKVSLPSDSNNFTVLVSEACSPDEFYVQSANCAEEIDELCTSLFTRFTSNKYQPLAHSPGTGSLICAKFSQDGAWYRAEVLESSTDSCRVRFIDFGNTEVARLCDMTECPPEFVSIPILASCCRLGGVTPPTDSTTWSDETTQLLKEATSGVPLQAVVVDSACSPPALKLTNKEGVDIASELINRGLAAAPRVSTAVKAKVETPSVSTYPQVASLSTVPLPSDNDSFTVLVTEVTSPSKLYIQAANSAGRIDELCTSLFIHFTSNKPQPLTQPPGVGSLVCAKFSQDGAWYRANVLEHSSDSCRVRFIDFGNAETVRLCDMTECPSEFISIPILASCCQLGGVAPPTGSATWSDETTQLLKEATSGVPLQAVVVDSACSPPALKLTNKEGVDIASELINRGLAAAPRVSTAVKAKVETPSVSTYPQVASLSTVPLPSDNDSFTVLVTEVTSPSKLYIQAANSAGRIDELCTSLFIHFTSNKPQPLTQPPGVGSLVCAKFSQDGAWYRANVLEHSSDSCRVRFIDFGNAETVRLCDMTECPSEFISIPILASCCQLGGVAPPTGSATWSDEATQLLKEATSGVPLQAVIVDPACSPPTLKLTNSEDVELATELINRGLATALRASPTIAEVSAVRHVHSITYPQVASLPKAPLLSDSENFTVLVTEFSSPDEFYVHTADLAGKVDELCSALCTHFTSNESQPLTQPPGVGSLVCAKFSQDGAWYRVKVLKHSSDSYHVRFIDFGNVEVVRLSDMTECPTEFVSIPILAYCCRLGGVTPPTGSATWSDEATRLLKEATASVPLLAEVVDAACSPPALKLTNSEDMDLRAVLVSKGLAATSKPSDLSSTCTAKPARAPPDKACPTVASLQKVSLPPENERFFLVVTDVYSPDELYFQTLEDAGAIDELVELLNKHFSENKPVSFPQTPATGSLVCAKFSQDGGWYRGEVLETSADCCRILFIDYGNIESVKLSNMAKCPSEFISSAYPRLASCCRLSGVAPPTGSTAWSKEATQLLLSMASNSLSEGVIVDKSASLPSIKLKNDTIADFAAELVAKGLARCSGASPSPINQCPPKKQTPAHVPEYPKVSGMQKAELGNELDYFPVIISDIWSPEAFFIIPINQKTLMEELRNGLNSHFKAHPPSPLSQPPSQGSLVCAKYSQDGAWYRSEVLEIYNNCCKLLFIDYGNLEVTKLEDIAPCPVKYASLPILATKCSLSGVTPSAIDYKTWSSGAIDQFKQLTYGVLNAKVVSEGCGGDTIPVELVDTSGSSDINIASELISRALSQHASARAAEVMFTPIPVADIPTGVPIKVRFGFINDPGDFFIHNCEKSSIAAFQEMGMTLQSAYNTSESNYCGFVAKVGALCCCRSLRIPDKSWYRCRVVSLTKKEAKIQSLDFGFIEKIPVDKLFYLDAKFVTLPAQAVPCYLSGIQPTSPFGWNNTSKAMFKSLLKEKMNAVVGKEVFPLLSNCGKRAISLFTGNGNKCVATTLIEGGHAAVDPLQSLSSKLSVKHSAPQITSHEPKVSPIPIPHGPIPMTKLFPVILTHVESLSEFYLQVVTKEKLEQLCELLRMVHEYAQTADDFKSLPPLGALCIAMHSDDSWYRAQVVKIVDKQTCSVFFFDFGNVGDVSLSKMKPVSEEKLLSCPVQALKCGLYGASVIPCTKQLEVMNLFSTLVPLETVKNCRIVSKYPLLVDLECGSGCPTLSVRDELARNGCLPKSNDLGLSSLPSNKLPADCKPVLVTEVKDPSDFWLQIIDESVAHQFEVLTGNIHYYATGGAVQNLVPVFPVLGQLCIAKYSQDDVWYRAKVIQVDKLSPLGDGCKVKVQFVDYGNEEIVDTNQLRPFQHHFKCLPAQAVHCQLVGFKVPAPNLAEEFRSLVENKKLFAVKKDNVPGELCTSVELIDSTGDEDIYIHLKLSRH